MVGVAGAARLMSQLRSLLLPINRLDRHVDIQDPRLTQYRLDACPQLAVEPFHASALLYAAHRSTHHVFTDRAAHVQQRRIEPISPHRVDMRIAPVSAQDREGCRAQYIHRALLEEADDNGLFTADKTFTFSRGWAKTPN